MTMPDAPSPRGPLSDEELREKAMGADPSRPGIFRDHNCWKCDSGKRPCAKGNPRNCEYPHARND